MNKLLSPPLVYYVLLAAVRDRLVLSLLLFMAVGTALAVMLGSSAVVEADQFAIVFASGGLRLAGVFGLILFAVFYIRRAFDTKDVDYLLSRPISRTGFILSHAAAFSLLAIGVAFFAVLAITALAPQNFDIFGYSQWALSLMIEYVMIINAALFFSMVISSAAGASMAVIGLYVLGRMMGQLLGIVDIGLPVAGFDTLATLMQGVSLIVPRLDLMAQTTWLVYGPGEDAHLWKLILAQGVVYTALLVAASAIDLRRRQF